jgi:hypothetical protein
VSKRANIVHQHLVLLRCLTLNYSHSVERFGAHDCIACRRAQDPPGPGRKAGATSRLTRKPGLTALSQPQSLSLAAASPPLVLMDPALSCAKSGQQPESAVFNNIVPVSTLWGVLISDVPTDSGQIPVSNPSARVCCMWSGCPNGPPRRWHGRNPGWTFRQLES